MRPVSLLALVAFAGCAGCGFGADEVIVDAGSWLETSPRAIACRTLADRECARLAECAPFLARTALGPTCVVDLRDRCLARAGLGGSKRSPAQITACAESVAQSACDVLLTAYPDVCDVPPGARELGAACTFHEQCASTFCAREAETACGVCAALPERRCVGGECGGGRVCTLAGDCATLGGRDAACGPNAPCSRLLYCDVDRCVPRKAPDALCAGFGECDAFGATTCAQDSVCRATIVARLGDACALTANALILCEAPARCISGVGEGRCRAAKPEGETCASSHECSDECLRGRCVRRTVETCPQK